MDNEKTNQERPTEQQNARSCQAEAVKRFNEAMEKAKTLNEYLERARALDPAKLREPVTL